MAALVFVLALSVCLSAVLACGGSFDPCSNCSTFETCGSACVWELKPICWQSPDACNTSSNDNYWCTSFQGGSSGSSGITGDFPLEVMFGAGAFGCIGLGLLLSECITSSREKARRVQYRSQGENILGKVVGTEVKRTESTSHDHDDGGSQTTTSTTFFLTVGCNVRQHGVTKEFKVSRELFSQFGQGSEIEMCSIAKVTNNPLHLMIAKEVNEDPKVGVGSIIFFGIFFLVGLGVSVLGISTKSDMDQILAIAITVGMVLVVPVVLASLCVRRKFSNLLTCPDGGPLQAPFTFCCLFLPEF